MKRVLIYSDTQDFGGHELMALEAIRYMASLDDLQIHVAYYHGNARFAQKLAQIHGNIHLIPLSHRSRSLPSLRVHFQSGVIASLMTLMKNVKPDLVIMIQGYIEICAAGLVAARNLGLTVVSYLATAKRMHEMGLRAGFIRDIFDRRLYKLPHGFLTISELMKAKLLERGIPNDRVCVVNNGVRIGLSGNSDRLEARRGFHLPDNAFVIGLIGRINFTSKGHDAFLRALKKIRTSVPDVRVLIVGDGPDEAKMKQIIANLGLEDMTVTVPWTDNMESVYAAVNAVALPSRSEVVPLVMLEAMSCGLPVIANRIEELVAFIPEPWLFDVDNPLSVQRAIDTIRNGADPSTLKRNKDMVAKEYALDGLGQRFHRCLVHLVHNISTDQ
jgi:glycosyltransferase involved in cell wall biosynthesis